MKRILFLSLLTCAVSLVEAQISAQGTLVNTSTNRVSVYAKPNSIVSNRNFRNIIVVVSILDQGAGNPTVIVDSNYVPNLSWDALPIQTMGGRAYFTFNGSDNGLVTTTTWQGNKNNKVITLSFSNSNGLNTVQLNDESPLGGTNGTMFWYVELLLAGGGDITNYSQKFYGTNPLPVNNANNPSFVGAQPLSILPVLFQDFNVSKQGSSDAFLTWTTSQEQNVSHFVLERSASQNSNWTKFAEVTAKGNSNTPTKYSYTDVKVYDGTAATKVVFYRIRSIDLDGQEKIFPIRSLRFSATGSKEIALYPNPAKDGFTISIPIVNPRDNMIRLNMINRIGQVVHSREISAATAGNYYYDIKTPGIINGEYMLQIIYDGELLDTKKVIIQQ